MAHGPNTNSQKNYRLATFANCGNFVAMLSSIASGARDKSEIFVLDIFKNILNVNKHATKSTVSSFDSI